MKKFTKLVLAAMLVMTAVAGVGCSKADDKSATTTNTTTDKKEDTEKVNRAVFAAVLIADEKMTSQFSKAVKGIDDAGKDTSYSAPARSKDDAVTFLDPYWTKDAAGKEYDAILGDATLLGKVNKEVEAKVNKDNTGKADDKKAKFTALTTVADSKKLGTNDLSGAKAQFADAKVESKDGKYTVEYKGLKYTLEKSGTSYKVVSKEGTLSK